MALHFDSSAANTYISHGSDAALDDQDPFTFACWFRITEAVHDILVRIADKATASGGWGLSLHDGGVWANTTIRFLHNRATTNAEDRITNTVSTNTWYFVAVTMDSTNGPLIYLGDESTLIVEGTHDTSMPAIGSGGLTSHAAADLYTANRFNSPDSSNGLRGDVARVGFWQDELSLAQLQALQFAPLSVWAATGTNKIACDYLHGISATQDDAGPGQNSGTVTGTLSLAAHPHIGPLLVEFHGSDPYVVAANQFAAYYHHYYRSLVAT